MPPLTTGLSVKTKPAVPKYSKTNSLPEFGCVNSAATETHVPGKVPAGIMLLPVVMRLQGPLTSRVCWFGNRNAVKGVTNWTWSPVRRDFTDSVPVTTAGVLGTVGAGPVKSKLNWAPFPPNTQMVELALHTSQTAT